MKIRRTLALVLAIVMAFALAACGNAEPAGEDGGEAKTEIVAALNSVPGNLDISATMGVALLSVSPHIYDYLIDMDEDYNFIPAIATSWERVDDTTWTFECDVSGYTFSNGDPLEMDDIIFSIDHLYDCAPMASYMSNIEDYYYEGNTLTIKMVEPNQLTIRNIFPTLCPILNKSYCEEKGEAAFINSECGTGPYKITSYVPGDSIVLERRDDYTGTMPQLTKITFKQIDQAANRYIALETGEVQFANELGYRDYLRAVDNTDLETYEMAATGLTFFAFNTSKPPFDDERVRLAMCYAMDRESWCAITEGVEPLYTMVSSAYVGAAEKPASSIEFDLDKAKELLEEAGYNESNPLSFEIQIYESSPAAEAYQSTLRSIGVNASITMYERGTVTNMCRSGDHGMALMSLYSVSGSALFEAGCYRNGNMRNFALYENDELDELIHQAEIQPTEEEMNVYINEAHEAATKYMPFLPVANLMLYGAQDASLQGVLVRPDCSFNFRNAYFA